MPSKFFLNNIFPNALSEADRKEFEEGINRINVARGRLTAQVFILVEILILVVTLLLKKGNAFKAPNFSYTMMYLVMLLGMSMFYWVFRELSREIAGHGKAVNIAGDTFACFILSWCAGISLLDSGQLMVYIFAVIAVAITPLYKPRVLFLIYLPVQAAFLGLLAYFHRISGFPSGTAINSTAFIIIAWAISYMRYKRQAATFNGQKLIEAKNLELQAMNARLQEANKKLEELSRIDGLTGVYNRIMFDRTLRLEWDRSCRQFGPLALIMIDIDFFKAYNDHYGHQAGDLCIRQVADTLTASAKRAADSVARYGGEEFAVILPGMTLESAAMLAEQMRKRVEDLKISHAASSVSAFVTISLGIHSEFPSVGKSIDDFVRNADKALYKAKKRHNAAVTYDSGSIQADGPAEAASAKPV